MTSERYQIFRTKKIPKVLDKGIDTRYRKELYKN